MTFWHSCQTSCSLLLNSYYPCTFYCTGLIKTISSVIHSPIKTIASMSIQTNNVYCLLAGTFLNCPSAFFWCNFCRCEVGTENWTQCNDHPIKICKYPVSGLFEGHSYHFRVRAVNSHGISKPSRMSDPIAALDPTEFEKLHGGFHWSSTNKSLPPLPFYSTSWEDLRKWIL